MVAATKQIVETSKQMGFEFDPDEEPKEEKEDDDAPNQMGMMAMPFFGGMGAGNPNDVEKNKVWKSAIKKVLTEEQAAKWNAWVKDREAFLQRVAVNGFIAKVDRKLLLSPEQREKLTAHVDSKHGKKLAKQAADQDANQFGMNVFFAGAMAAQFGGNEDNEKEEDPVQSILNESQYEQWKEAFVPQLDQLAGANGAFGAMNILAPAFAVGEPVDETEEDEDNEDDDN